MRARRARVGLVAGLAFTVIASAGCGSDSAAATGATVDLTKLDTGSYATKPQQLEPKDPDRMGRIMEALRLGDVMPLPKDIDPALTHNLGGVHPFIDAKAFGTKSVFASFSAENFTASTPGLVAGFGTAAASNEDHYGLGYQLRHAVMIFDSDEAASAAAGALAGMEFDKEKADPTASVVHPSAHVVWIPKFQALASWYTTGRFVISDVVNHHENMALDNSDLPALLALSDKAISVTVDRLKTFQPTPVDKLTELPFDPQGLLRLALLRPDGDQTAFGMLGTLNRQTALHLADDPDKERELFDKTGVDYIGYGAGKLVRTRDAEAAQKYFGEVAFGRLVHRIDSPPGLPTARCVKYQGPETLQFPYLCYVTYGRYAVEMWSQQQQDVYQRISAQYAILANDK
ncbi:DUF7373 family lipoprotein [Nocardia concava]|uniref:DUF7373 family lipoprotein n=1 Tax=Nocardia concava TaxID=257281 RepID=UPI0012FCC987|nr:hypothetical protein [Nocardia concava]